MALGADAAARPPRARPLVRAGIVGLGGALPERVVSNDEISPAIGVEDDWIVRRTGIRERRYADPAPRSPSSPRRPARAALADAGARRARSSTSCSSRAAARTRSCPTRRRRSRTRSAPTAPAPSTSAAPAPASSRRSPPRAAMLACGRARHALVIGAEIMSRHVDPADRNTAALFGDGAGAVV